MVQDETASNISPSVSRHAAGMEPETYRLAAQDATTASTGLPTIPKDISLHPAFYMTNPLS